MKPNTPEQGTEGVSYFKEMLGHPVSLLGGMGSIITGVGVLFVTGTLPFAILPALGYIGLTTIAAMFVPSSPVFRSYIDRIKKDQAREEERGILLEEIQARTGPRVHEERTYHGGESQYSDYWTRYDRMTERLTSLKKIASSRNTAITNREMDRLDQATLDFLRLFHARVILRERMNSSDPRAVGGQIAQLEKQISAVKNAADRKRMEQAKADLEKVLDRFSSLQARDSTTAASMLSMSDTFEEVYQRIVTNPTSSVSETLMEVEEKLSIEEELVSKGDEELNTLLQKARVRAQAAQS